MTKNITLPNAQATKELGRKLGQSLPAGSIILLEGELGAGKTTLVQGIGEGLGIKDVILSPTFTLIQEYSEGRIPLYHLDLYRLQSTEVGGLYLDTYWEGKEVSPGITVIEWAQRLPYKPLRYLQIELSYLAGEGRQAKIEKVGDWGLESAILILKSNK
jgi:tRNA threonylcarbamoyladenosine biosynthesis protein TsaE